VENSTNYSEKTMFKVIAILGAVAGGAGYGLYAHTDLFNNETAPLTKKSCCQGKDATTATPSCCATPCPSCADGCDGCPLCEVDCSACCGSAASVAAAAKKPEACCAAKKPCCETQEACCATTSPVSARVAKTKKAPSCCANPCAACADGCDWCPLCEVDCSACCGLSANTAVAGPAAVAGVVKAKK
jgi:hypothetical protein